MVLYDYLEGKLDNLGKGKLTLVRSQYSELTLEGVESLTIEPQQTTYTLRHTYKKHGEEHILGVKVIFNFTADLLSIYHTPSESTQSYQLKTFPLLNVLEEFTSDKVKSFYREVTAFIETLVNSFQSGVSGVRLQPSLYVYKLFHDEVTFSIASELLNGEMNFKLYTSQETLLMKRVLNHPQHIGVFYQGHNRFYKDVLAFEPPYDTQVIWSKLEEIRG